MEADEGREEQCGVGECLVDAVPGLGQRGYMKMKWSMAGSVIGVAKK